MTGHRFKWVKGGGCIAQLWSVYPSDNPWSLGSEIQDGFVCEDEAGIYWWALGSGPGEYGRHERSANVRAARAALLAFARVRRGAGGPQLDLFAA